MVRPGGEAVDERHGILRHVNHPQKIADKVGSADMLRQTNALLSTSFFNLAVDQVWPGGEAVDERHGILRQLTA
jgi:hypothetical protein